MGLTIQPIKGIFKHSKETKEGIGEKERNEIREVIISPINPTPTTTLGSWAVTTLNATQEVFFMFHFPKELTSIDEVKVIIIPDTTETIQIDLDSNMIALGEDFDNRNNSEGNAEYSVTINDLTEIDVSTMVTDVLPNDYWTLRLSSNTSDLRIVGLRIKYTQT